MLDELLQRVKLGPRGDVVAAAVQLPDLVVLDVVALGLIPVSYGEGEGTCATRAEEVSVKDLRVLESFFTPPPGQRHLWWFRSPAPGTSLGCFPG